MLLRPDVGAQWAHTGADEGARTRAATGDGAEHGASDGAYTRARGGAALGYRSCWHSHPAAELRQWH